MQYALLPRTYKIIIADTMHLVNCCPTCMSFYNLYTVSMGLHDDEPKYLL